MKTSWSGWKTRKKTAPPTDSALQPPTRFAPPKSAAEALIARQKGIPKKTQQDTNYCKNIWDEWRKHRSHVTGTEIGSLDQLPLEELAHWLTMFILEARKKTGEVYPPNTLHHIVCGLMR